MLFSLKQSIKSLVASPFVTAVVTLSLVGGLLAFFLALGNADEFISDTQSYKYGDDGDYYMWVVADAPFDIDGIDPADLGAEHIESVEGYYLRDNMSDDGKFVCAVDPGFEEYFHSRLVSGRYFDENDAGAVAIIEIEAARKQDLSVGDRVNILGADYEIVGIVKMNVWLGKYIILKSFAATQPQFLNYFNNHEIVVGSPPEDFDSSRITGVLPSRNQNEGWSEDVFWQYIKSAFVKIAVISVVGLCVFLYAIMNLMIVADFRSRSRMSELGLKLTLGASPRKLYFESFFEYLVMNLTASLILIAASPLISRVVGEFISWRLGMLSGVGLLLFAVLSAELIAAMTTGKTKGYGYSLYDMMSARAR